MAGKKDSNCTQNRASVQDHGWAWVVLSAASFNLCVDLGISLGSGVYVAEVIKNWEVSKANAALIGSVLYGIMFCFGKPANVCVLNHSSVNST